MGNTPNNYGFYQPDLRIELIECIDMKVNPTFPQIIKGFHTLIYIAEGEYEIVHKNESFKATKGALIISDKKHYFNFRRLTRNGSVLKIHCQESALKEFAKYDVFKFFYKIAPATCIYPATFNQTICFNVLNSMKEALAKHYSEFYVKTKLLAILAEIDLYYKDVRQEEKSDKSNLSIDIIEFVEQNYSSKITYTTLKERFFISDSFINKIFKDYSGLSFKEFLNTIRLKRANELMDNKYQKISLVKVAQLCGFTTYSTFYREYVKMYGVSPKTVHEQNKEKWKKSN